jgi:hypothetical protein
MNENSFEFFQEQVEQVKRKIDELPPWMRDSLDVATATLPSLEGETAPARVGKTSDAVDE